MKTFFEVFQNRFDFSQTLKEFIEIRMKIDNIPENLLEKFNQYRNPVKLEEKSIPQYLQQSKQTY